MTKFLSILLAGSVLLAACNKSANKAGDEPELPILKVATDATWPPMEYISSSKEIIGFDIDLLHAVAKAAGFQVEIRNAAWDGIFAGLNNGSYDLVASSVTITEERKEAMDFSMPYVNAGQVLIVRNETEGVTQLSDLVGAAVGAQIGTTGAFAIGEVDGISSKSYDELGLAISDLVNGKIDAVVADNPTAADFALNSPEYKEALKIVGEPFTEEYYGIAIKKGNREVLDLVNKGIASIKTSGELDKLVQKWLK